MSDSRIHNKPLVAVIGRPNVGKSTLFNRFISERKAIVEDIPGVTRDRIYADTQWDGREFSLVDTGGFDPEGDELYPSLIKNQINIAIEEADLILCVLDGKEGVMPHDVDVIDLLRKVKKPVIFAVNKIDHKKHEDSALEFHGLGIEGFIVISALQGRNVNELLDKIIELLPPPRPIEEEVEEDIIKVAVLGKPNVGKSTLVNRFLGEDRLMTSPVPGTTRDSIDTYITRDEKKYLLIDTAGIRRKSKITFSVERHSVFRAVRAMERADIALLIIDVEEGPTHQDARLARLIADKGRGCIILLNKWDLVPSKVAETPGVDEILKEELMAVDFAPVLIISATTGRGVNKIFDYIDVVYKNFSQKISTKRLNLFLKNIIEKTPPPIYKGKEIKFYYISQPLTEQPTFVIFTNRISGVPENYKRFLENRLREKFDLEGTPIKLVFRSNRNEG
ncbi:MAG: ribosome biogenesis GTPase Der [Candidatus Dadabacteria bacterium]|jgi:GTP-binding protein|nr:ribosome biogenesis GTPase Der [Candidatus Dadabacteria bacterium]MCZ6791480.1 ribosome biogenesis GTPase Der [Candidatus Dadabacteria bacterium]